MTDFTKAVDYVLLAEGGYSFDAADAGGETNFGISKRSYPGVDIKNLTRDGAIAIYKKDYWDANQLGAVSDQDVALKVLDLLVNMGAHSGAQVVQKALCGLGHTVEVDGVFGTNTIAACNQVDSVKLLQELRAQAALRYVEIVLAKPEQKKFILGWLRRAVKP